MKESEIKDQMEMQRMTNAAVEIAKHVNNYISKHSHAQMNDDPAASLFLESMAVSYAVALRSFSVYREIAQLERPTWEKFEEDAIAMIKTCFKQIEHHLAKENIPKCQLN